MSEPRRQSPGWSWSTVSWGGADVDAPDLADDLNDINPTMSALTASAVTTPAMSRTFRRDAVPVRWPTSSYDNMNEPADPPGVQGGSWATGAPHRAQTWAVPALSAAHSRHLTGTAPAARSAATDPCRAAEAPRRSLTWAASLSSATSRKASTSSWS